MQQKPLLFIDIEIGNGKKQRITVYSEDDPTELASLFCKKHGFDNMTQDMLVK